MKCKFCGAEIKEGSRVCEYCGSEAERDRSGVHVVISDSDKSTPKSIVSIIGKVIVALAGIWAALIVITLIVTLNSDTFKNAYSYTANANAVGEADRKETGKKEIPRNETDLTAQILSCDKKGVVSIECDGVIYEDVKILDKALIKWLNDTDRTIDRVEIRFATDKNGDISELGLRSTGFFIMAKEGTHYIAARDEQIISFTSQTPLETGRYYGGYFSYPDMRLYSGEVKNPFAMSRMDQRCDDKETASEQEYYTGEEVTIYKIYAKDTWFYCSKEIYDTVSVGDPLDDYKLCSENGLDFMVEE